MFFEALQSYYAPTVGLFVFAALLLLDQLLSKRERRLFLWELGVVALMIFSTWADRCVSGFTTGGWWHLRFFTSALQFAAAPLSPLILVRIYLRNQSIHRDWLLSVPAILTAVLSLSSPWTGLVLQVEPGNIYSRGPLFLLPFASSAIYILFILYLASRKNTPGRRLETIFLICAGALIAGACLLEIVFVIRYMIWSTTATMLLLYFLLLNILKVLYDPQTGVYSRLAYSNRLASLREEGQITFAMVDMNGLKNINDLYGHTMGDQAILQLSQALLSITGHGRKLYRYGGDEFIIIAQGLCGEALKEDLKIALTRCGHVEQTPISFASGVVEYQGGDLHHTTEEMDRRMYQNKQEMRAEKSIQNPDTRA